MNREEIKEELNRIINEGAKDGIALSERIIQFLEGFYSEASLMKRAEVWYTASDPKQAGSPKEFLTKCNIK